MSITINGLHRLQFPTNDDFAFAIAAKGRDIAAGYYSGTSVSVVLEDGNPAKVVAEGANVRYLEYGTGTQGQTSGYQGNLPTEPIRFESPKGEPQETNGWEYNYDNPKTKVTVNGQLGWYFGGKFTTGRPAEAQMWKTSRDLRQQTHRIIKDTIINKLGGSNAL